MTSNDSTTTEQPQAALPPPPPPAAQPLRRSRTDRKIAGVAGGLGRYANVDPLILRILFVVLAVFGGSGLVLYALAWLLIPDEGEDESEAQKLVAGRSASSTAQLIGLAAVLILGLALVGAFFDSGPGLGGLGVLVVVALVVVLMLRRDQSGRPAASQVTAAASYGPPPAYPPASGAYGQTPGTAYTPPSSGETTPPAPPPPAPPGPGWASPPAPPPQRAKSILGRVTVSVALIVIGLMVGWNGLATGDDNDFRAVAVFGAALAVVAGGLLVGAVYGRARGLVVLAIVLSIATAIAGAADDKFSTGIGERTWSPGTVPAAEREFRLGVGDADLDLTELPPGSDATVDVRLGVGDLRVQLPPEARAVIDSEIGAGNLRLPDRRDQDGTDLSVRTTIEPVDTTGPVTTLRIDARVGFGQLEVTR